MSWLSRNLAKLGASDAIDTVAVDGLSGVSNSLAYKVHEIEKHFHNSEDSLSIVQGFLFEKESLEWIVYENVWDTNLFEFECG